MTSNYFNDASIKIERFSRLRRYLEQISDQRDRKIFVSPVHRVLNIARHLTTQIHSLIMTRTSIQAFTHD
jgi:hypothetical protein